MTKTLPSARRGKNERLEKYVLFNCNVCTGEENAELMKNVNIYVDCGVITAITERGSQMQPGYHVMDMTGLYVMPGLINAHSCLLGSGPAWAGRSKTLQSVWKTLSRTALGNKLAFTTVVKNLRTALYSGVTSLRCTDDSPEQNAAIALLCTADSSSVPRLITAVNAQAGGDAAGQAKAAAAKGAGVLSIHLSSPGHDVFRQETEGDLPFAAEELTALCKAAKANRLVPAAEVQSPAAMGLALDCGVSSLEHGCALSDELIGKFLQTGAAYVCTLSALEPAAKLSASETGLSSLEQYAAATLLEGAAEGARMCLERGILLGMGSDAGRRYCSHYDMWRELDCFTRLLHVSNAAAIHCATMQNARILGIDSVTGSVAQGKAADLLVLDRDPMEHLSAIKNPIMVITHGHIINRPRVRRNKKTEQLLDTLRRQDISTYQ